MKGFESSKEKYSINIVRYIEWSSPHLRPCPQPHLASSSDICSILTNPNLDCGPRLTFIDK